MLPSGSETTFSLYIRNPAEGAASSVSHWSMNEREQLRPLLCGRRVRFGQQRLATVDVACGPAPEFRPESP